MIMLTERQYNFEEMFDVFVSDMSMSDVFVSDVSNGHCPCLMSMSSVYVSGEICFRLHLDVFRQPLLHRHGHPPPPPPPPLLNLLRLLNPLNLLNLLNLLPSSTFSAFFLIRQS